MYGKELEYFIKASIDYITKVEFLLAFRAAYDNTMTTSNALGGFRGTSLVSFNPQAVITKLDVKLQTLTPTGPPSAEADIWVSQTPHTAAETVS